MVRLPGGGVGEKQTRDAGGPRRVRNAGLPVRGGPFSQGIVWGAESGFWGSQAPESPRMGAGIWEGPAEPTPG